MGSEEDRQKYIDRLISRKVDVAKNLAAGNIYEPAPSGRVIIGFTGILDFPEGSERRSIDAIIADGVPSLYGYN